MRRTARLVAASLVLGLLTTIALAWGCAWFVKVASGPTTSQSIRPRNPAAGEGEGMLSVHRTTGWGSVFLDTYVAPPEQRFDPAGNDRLSPEEMVPSGLRSAALPWIVGQVPWPPADSNDVRAIDARGWPMLCLWSEYRTGINEQFQVIAIPRGAIVIPRNDVNKGKWIKPYPRTLPLRPIWAGLAVNTIAFAVPWWILLAVPRLARRRWRIARSQCPECGYALGGLPKCPECGNK